MAGLGRFCSMLPARGLCLQPLHPILCSLSHCCVFLLSWKDNPAMPDGLIYEGVSDEPMEYSGGSAAQSTILHAFDELLGIRHSEESGKTPTAPFSQGNKG